MSIYRSKKFFRGLRPLDPRGGAPPGRGPREGGREGRERTGRKEGREGKGVGEGRRGGEGKREGRKGEGFGPPQDQLLDPPV